MVDVQVAGVREGGAGVGVQPFPGLDAALAVVAKLHARHALGDEHLLPRVLAVAVIVDPVAPVIAVVARKVVGRLRDGERQVDGGRRRRGRPTRSRTSPHADAARRRSAARRAETFWRLMLPIIAVSTGLFCSLLARILRAVEAAI